MPIISLYLKNELGFSGSQTGFIMSLTAFSSLLSPIIAACIADRIISAERLLFCLHLVGSLLLFGLYLQKNFAFVLIFNLLYWLTIGPTSALTTAITFHHSPNAVKNFGPIRLWGTIGWICAAWFFRIFLSGKFLNTNGSLRYAILMGIVASIVLSLFSLTIPTGSRKTKGKIVLFPKDSLKIIFEKPVLIFCVFAMLIAIADRFYVFGAPLFLKSLNFKEGEIMAYLSIGQIPEILCLAIFGSLISRLGIKKIFLLGIFLEIFRFSIFSVSTSLLYVFSGIAVHGLTYSLIFVAASIYLDKKCTVQSRAGVHQFFGLFVTGISTLIGNLLAGIFADIISSSFLKTLPSYNSFTFYWIIPLILSIVGFIGILFFFNDNPFHVSSQKNIVASPEQQLCEEEVEIKDLEES